MLIIIEGTDRTGKSTLAARLSAQLSDTEVWHRSKPTEHPLTEYETTLDDYPSEDFGPRHVIIDRWHWGERVWPTVFERSSDYDLPMFAHTELFLRSRGARLNYAYRHNISKQLADMIHNDEPVKEMDDLQLAYDLFGATHRNASLPVMSYDYETNDDSFRFLEGGARVQAAVARPMAVTTQWIGSARPRVLLVGDRFSPRWNPVLDPAVPFVPYRGTSGHFLFEQLVKTMWWKDCAIVNAFEPDGTRMPVLELWDALGSPPVIALGNEAHDMLSEEGLDAVKVPHPQYVRRFLRGLGDNYYRDLLTSALAA